MQTVFVVSYLYAHPACEQIWYYDNSYIIYVLKPFYLNIIIWSIYRSYNKVF